MALRRFTETGLYGLDPIKHNAVVVFDDFTDETALSTSTSGWIITNLSSGTGVTSTDIIGGALILANDGTNDDSGSQVQWDTESFKIQASKDISFAVKFNLPTPDQAHFFAGLGITDTSYLSGLDTSFPAALANTAGLGFYVADASATMYLVAINGASTLVGTLAIMTLVASTEYTAEFVMRGGTTAGDGTIEVYINGLWITTTRFTGMSTTEMAPTLAYVSGAAGTAAAQCANIDWVACAAER